VVVEPKSVTKLRGVLVGDANASDITIRDGIVTDIAPAARGRVDAGSATSIIGPPLFDIQINGCGGVNLQSEDVRPEDLRRVTDLLAEWGVSRWVPTLITLPQDRLELALAVFAEALQDPVVRKAVPGFHVEGPYISPEDGPRGAHTRAYVRAPSLREFDRWQQAAGGKILYLTVAPEVKGAIPFISRVVARGAVVSLGHHNAGAEQIARAVDAGATLCTHLGNGCSPVMHRHHNPLWPQLADDRLACSIIADLEHLPEPVLQVFVRALGRGRVVLTSDAVHLAGLRPGRYKLAAMDVELKRSGRIALVGTDLLAGSSLMLLQGVVNLARVTDFSLADAYAAATTVPAKVLGLSGSRPARLAAGKKADLVLFDVVDGHGRVERVYIDGRAIRR
jgi:N-acetylglucosamine-6-phosphate deacetylase